MELVQVQLSTKLGSSLKKINWIRGNQGLLELVF